MKRFILTLAAIVTLGSVGVDAARAQAFSVAAEPGDVGMMEDVTSVLSKTGEHDILLRLVERSGLVSIWSKGGPITVFAPNDAAFAALSDEEIERLSTDGEALRMLLAGHVVPGRIYTVDMMDGLILPSLSNEEIPVEKALGIHVADASLEKSDMEAFNGIVHSIDKVLVFN